MELLCDFLENAFIISTHQDSLLRFFGKLFFDAQFLDANIMLRYAEDKYITKLCGVLALQSLAMKIALLRYYDIEKTDYRKSLLQLSKSIGTY